MTLPQVTLRLLPTHILTLNIGRTLVLGFDEPETRVLEDWKDGVMVSYSKLHHVRTQVFSLNQVINLRTMLTIPPQSLHIMWLLEIASLSEELDELFEPRDWYQYIYIYRLLGSQNTWRYTTRDQVL
jgi:hypothetical protein